MTTSTIPDPITVAPQPTPPDPSALTNWYLASQVKLQKQTRNAIRFLAWAFGIQLALGLAAGLFIGIRIADAVNSQNTGTAATTTAAVTAAYPVTLVTNERHLDDTTSVPTGKNDPSGGGPIWAYDDVSRIVTIAPDPSVTGAFDVTVTTIGYAHPFANPITGKAWHPKHAVYMIGDIRYVVTPPAGIHPVAKLPTWTNATYRSGGILNEAFGLPRGSSLLTHAAGDGHYSFTYFGVPGAPNGGLYSQVG